MVQTVLNRKLNEFHPVQLENFNRDFETLLDAIALKDIGTVALLLERYHIPADGIFERIVARAIGSSIKHYVYEPLHGEGDE